MYVIVYKTITIFTEDTPRKSTLTDRLLSIVIVECFLLTHYPHTPRLLHSDKCGLMKSVESHHVTELYFEPYWIPNFSYCTEAYMAYRPIYGFSTQLLFVHCHAVTYKAFHNNIIVEHNYSTVLTGNRAECYTLLCHTNRNSC